MSSKQKIFWRSIQPLVGSVIGVGIFGLPYAYAQAGFLVGLGHLVVISLIHGLLLLMYADIVMNTKGHPRLTGIVRRYLGLGWSWAATILMMLSIWGAMVAYIIIGGQFLHALLAPLLGGEIMLYQLLFFAVSAVLLIGGLGFVSRLQVFFVLALLVMLALILAGALPHASLEHLTEFDAGLWFLPFGVTLFAFGGIAAIPEMAQILGRYKRKLRPAIIVGLIIVSVVYVIFSAIVIAVTGPNTSSEAIIGLGEVVGPWVMVIGSIVGLFSVFTSFLILGIALMDTIIYDFQRRYLVSWLVAVLVPLVIFLAGARSFIEVIGFTGGVFVSLIGLIVIYTYYRAKKDVCTSKRCLSIPNWVIGLCALVFLFGAIATVLGV